MQTTLTTDRCQLILEGLWDQLDLAIAPLRSSDEQPAAMHVALSRIISYRIRLRQVIETVQLDATGDAATRRHLAAALIDVLTILDAVETQPQADWIGILYEAQDAVLASLHDMRVEQNDRMGSDDRIDTNASNEHVFAAATTAIATATA